MLTSVLFLIHVTIIQSDILSYIFWVKLCVTQPIVFCLITAYALVQCLTNALRDLVDTYRTKQSVALGDGKDVDVQGMHD